MHVVVVGGGIVGVSSAYWLAERGVDVTLCERDGLGSGSTDRALGGIRAQFSTEVNVALSVASERIWDTFADRFGTGIDRRRTGYLFLTRDEETAAALDDQVAMQAAYDVPSRVVSPTEAAEIAPGVRSDAFVAGTYSPADSFADPHLALQGFADAAREAGADLRTDTPVIDFHSRATADASPTRADGGGSEKGTGRASATGAGTGGQRGVGADGESGAGSQGATTTPTATPSTPVGADPAEIEVETADGSLIADCVVNAAGAWSPRLAELAGYRLPVEPHRRQIVIVEPERPVPADDPLTIDLDTTAHYRPERDGRAVVGGHFGSDDPVVDPDEFSTEPDLDWQAEAVERAGRVATYFG
ncbi:MAG: NAD(P)/FAD-dependent oxidoreductase, partial [Halobaculum sp.]